MRSGWLLAACLALAPVVGTPSAGAQTPNLQITPKLYVAPVKPIIAGAPFEVVQSRTSSRAIGGPTGPAALQSFQLNFTNGDHKLKSLTMLRSGTLTDMKIGDNDGNDPFEGKARYLPLAADFQVRTAAPSSTCGASTCDVPIDMPADHVFVLAGFSMVHPSADQPIRALGVVPYADHGFVRVTMESEGWNSPGNVTIQYIAVPRARIASQTHCSGVNCVKPPPAIEARVLQGFYCRKRGGALSFVKVVGVNPGSDTGSQFTDNNGSGECSAWVAGLK